MTEDLRRAGVFAFDTETRAEDYAKYPDGALRKMTMRCDIASFAAQVGGRKHAWVIPLGMLTMQCMAEEAFFDTIKPIMEDMSVLKFAWNFNYDASLYANYGVWVACYEDVMVKAHLLDENKGAGLKTRCADGGMELTPFPFKEYWKLRHLYQTKALAKDGTLKVNLADLEPHESRYTSYAAEDSIATLELSPIYDGQLDALPKLKELYHRLLNPSVRTLFNMERRGLPLDRTYVRVIGMTCKEDRDAAEVEVFRQAGQHFNLASTKDLSRILYTELGLPVFKTTEKGANSTDSGSLEKLAEAGHKIAEAILRWRRLEKLYGGYLDPDGGLTQACYAHGAIHTSYNICGTVTGRLSSSGPNCQQFPRSSPKTYNIRKAFVPHLGYCLVGGDMSQVELRMMAHFSGDQNMIEEYTKDEPMWRALNEGRSIEGMSKSDIHQQTADACNCDRNPTAKNINFGLLYGMMEKRLASVLTSVNFQHCLEKGIPFDHLRDVVSLELAGEFHTRFFNMHPGIRAYQEHIATKAKSQGYIDTRYGRRRRLPDIYSGDRWLVMAACRMACNCTIQGHVGEMMTLAMSRVENVIDNPDGRALQKLGYRMFLQAHDELLGECPDKAQTILDVKHHLTRICQNPALSSGAYPFSGYRVPIVFEARSGMTWHEVH